MIKAREAMALAENVVAKAVQRNSLMFVYLDGQEVKCVTKASPVFQRSQAAGFPNAIGVYSRRCDPKMIKEDIIYATKGLPA